MPMPKKDSEILTRNFTYLENNIDASHLLTFLFQRFIINDEDMTRIGKIVNRTARNTELLQTLLHRGDRAWSAFIAAMRDRGYTEVANDLFLPNNVNVSNPNLVPSVVSPRLDGGSENELTLAVYQQSYRESGEASAYTLRSVRTPANVDLQEQINIVSDENEQLKVTIEEKDQAIAEKDQTIAEKDDTIIKLNQEICSLNDKIERLQTEENKNTQKITELRKEVATLQDEVNKRLLKLEKGKSQATQTPNFQ
ncbi:hypothetical protein LOTGIDRAFT_172769 [Lottia gigantea]|uniref:CARD domain-containing protein n=1 Tax=Lottia gigantea TaxID=225164 RepID=V4CGD6_LOTGI|nr:hypothetical protein LOTGIDRAFT_172769 [Lottia gigantea]ESP01140.1 hypothetical protein LOTGIDRAFT_172769 [Lottia gigantea]